MKKLRPLQEQDQQPGREHKMVPLPKFEAPTYRGSGKLLGKVALITGGDSGIGRAVAVLFAREGADVAIVYLEENKDALTTKKEIEDEGQKCFLIMGDISKKKVCMDAVAKTQEELGGVNILVNNAAIQFPSDDILTISEEQLKKTFETNIFSYFYMVQASLPFMHEGDSIINTTSVTAYRGSEHLIDYSATKGAIVTFTRSLAVNLVGKKIRVNGVAPGPIWTPLIPATFPAEEVATFGADTPMGRAGEPEEVAPAFVFLASSDSSYMTGQIIHVNGGDFISS